MTDCLGLVIGAVVHPANVQDRDGAHLLLTEEFRKEHPKLTKIWADSGYAGRCKKQLESIGFSVEVVRRSNEGTQYAWVPKGTKPPPRPLGFEVVKRRWVVERTFAWLYKARRLSKDYEHTIRSSETWLFVAMASLMVKRLAPIR